MIPKLRCHWPYEFPAQVDIEDGAIQGAVAREQNRRRQIMGRTHHFRTFAAEHVVDIVGKQRVVFHD